MSPRIKGQGHSVHTIEKQIGLAAFLSQHMNAVGVILKKNQWWPQSYCFIDTNAGCGRNDEEDCDGSPLIALTQAQRILSRYEMFFIESDQDRARQLIELTLGSEARIFQDDHNVAVPVIADKCIKKDSLGLIYHDPNGCPNIQMLENASKHKALRRMDILIRYNGAAVKRNPAYRSGDNLKRHLERIEKQFWMVRELGNCNKWQWTFLYGSNSPCLKAWKSMGFHYIDSADGQQIIERLWLTNDDRNSAHQGDLFNAIKIQQLPGISGNARVQQYSMFGDEKSGPQMRAMWGPGK